MRLLKVISATEEGIVLVQCLGALGNRLRGER